MKRRTACSALFFFLALLLLQGQFFVAGRRTFPQFSIKDFGASCNDADDDTAKIQAAHNALPTTGGTVLVPVGICRYTGLTIDRPMTLLGEGSGAHLKNIGTSGQHAITVSAIAGVFPVVRIYNLKITGAVGGGNGIHSTATTNMPLLDVQNVQMDDVGGHGIYLRNVQSSRFFNLVITDSAGWGIFLDGNQPGSTPNANTWEGIQLTANNGNLQLLGARNNVFIGGSFQGAASQSEIRIGAGTSPAQNNAFFGTWIEATTVSTVVRILGQQNRFDDVNLGGGAGSTAVQIEVGSTDNFFTNSRITGGTNAFQVDAGSARTVFVGGSLSGAIAGAGASAFWQMFTAGVEGISSPGNTYFLLENGGPQMRLRNQGATRYRADFSVGSGGLQLTVFDDTGAVHLPFDLAMTALIFSQPTLFANLGTPGNGRILYCSDCTFANPCASGGTGAIAKRLNGAWRCD